MQNSSYRGMAAMWSGVSVQLNSRPFNHWVGAAIGNRYYVILINSAI
jgi:hypothetical protein